MPDELTIDPAHMTEQDWAVLKRYLDDAAEAGEVVSISSHLATLTPAQVAKRLGMSRSTISRRIKAGDIQAIKVGSHHRISLPEFERFRDELVGGMIAAAADDLEADLAEA
jgi:excisionase family DNA binding protein